MLNLVSNAFKFTLEGEIAVTLRPVGAAAELRVRDTGVGIPVEEMPRLFERFHRVPNTQSRTHEGSGIGLALVQELARLHGGSVRAESRLGEGSTFIVSVPFGNAHFPPEHVAPERIGNTRSPASAAVGAAPFVEEALRWLPEHAAMEDSEPLPEEAFPPALPRGTEAGTSLPLLLVADDNTDMRHYLTRLLSERYQVQTVADGEAALAAARNRRPDLILSDVMMPRLDGISLVRKLRADAGLATVPVILLSARAGEESRVEGLQEGADDYLIKPFSARELLARLAAHLELARLRKQSEDAIRESEGRYRSLFEHMLDGFAYCRMLFDEQGRPDDFVYLAVNEAFERLTGLKDVVGKRVTELIPGVKELQPELFEIYGRVASTGNPERFEIHFKPLCLYLSISVYSPERACFVAVFDNITERKQAEEALRESEQRLRRLVDSNIIGIFTADENRVKTANDLFLEMIGATRDDLEAGRVDWRQLTAPEHLDKELRALEELKSRGWRPPFEKEYIHPDGTRVPVLMGAAMLKPEPLEWICFVIDLTERKALEARLREKQKLESIGLLAGGIAHDFNNLLVGILGNASLGQDMAPPNSPLSRTLGHIVDASERAAMLTRQMLAYSGKGRFLIEPVNLSNLVREMTRLLHPSIPSNVLIRFDLEPDLPSIEADSSQMQQVVMNLVLNAAEAIGNAPGAISVHTGRKSVDHAYIRKELNDADIEPGTYVFLQVRDSGGGMNEATAARIFDPFFTTKFTGRGLGLAAVSGIVRGHKGAIKVLSAPDQGSTFTVLFPASSTRQSGPVQPENQPSRAEPRGSGTVLVVDDEDIVLRMAKTALERHGYSVILAQNGRSAIEILKRERDRICAIVLDLSMPGMSGHEALPALRAIKSGVPVIVSSGFSETETMRLFVGQNPSGFIQKPYRAGVLAEKVKAAITAP